MGAEMRNAYARRLTSCTAKEGQGSSTPLASESNRSTQEAQTAGRPLAVATQPRFERDFSTVRVHADGRVALGEPFEQEAERTTDRIVGAARPASPEFARRKPVQLSDTAGRSAHESVPPIVRSVLRSPGESVDRATRGFMEARFQHNFGRVRIHTDASAAAAATAVNALAFTVGKDIVFGARQYVPHAASGKKLLAHELTHVVQQEQGPPLLRRQEKRTGHENKDANAPPQVSISGVVAAGGPLSEATTRQVNEAAKKVPAQWRRYVAYEKIVKVGGSLAWRANNPGNLRGANTAIATVPGASGMFAVFATMDDGRTAQKSLYLTQYGTQTVRAAVRKLTPPNENDTAAYLRGLERAGVKLDGTVTSQIDTLMAAVEVNEGLSLGTIVPRESEAASDVEGTSPWRMQAPVDQQWHPPWSAEYGGPY